MSNPTSISLYGNILYKNNNNTGKAYVYLHLKKRCLIQKNNSLSSISSNPKKLHDIVQLMDNKDLLATVVSSDGVKLCKIQHANIVKKGSIRMLRLTTSNKELYSKDNYAKNVTQIVDDTTTFKSASVIIAALSFVNNTPSCAPNCQGVNLSGRDLSGANLSRADLSGANLSDSRMWSANLSRANLSGANLSGADMRGAYGNYVNLSNANMTEANMENSRFFFASQGQDGVVNPRDNRDRAVNLSGANLTRADLRSAELTFANLTSVQADGAQAEAVNLARANLTNASMTNTNLSFARFDFANLKNANLAGANIRGTTFADTRVPGSEADLTGTNFRGAINCNRAFFGRLTNICR
jgi:uncharacterized protein YjbI with pentapeptide repeats